jgi:uncharacterized protein
MITRRKFLLYAGIGTYSLLRSANAEALATFPLKRRKKGACARFTPIGASTKDALVLPKGFQYDLIASYGDPMGVDGPNGPETFGYDNDFIAYFPMTALSGGNDPHHGLLWVNHEFVNPLMVSGVPRSTQRTKEQLAKERHCVGGSIIEVKQEKGKWHHVLGSRYAKRFTADYPEMRVTGPVAERHPKMVGTLANCSGGKTLWNTALSGEENYQLFNPSEHPALNWAADPEMGIKEDHYGWIVEVDPFGELPPTKHTALGHFSHENAALRLGATSRLAVYMGDDANDQFLYKYLSHEKYRPKASRKECSALLEKGTLFAADFAKGVWIPLDLERTPALKNAGFESQADVLLRTREAAKAAGATPLDRPEDCEVNPSDGSVYISLTNNSKHGNFHGQIVRLVEDGGNCESEKFRFEIFLAGGNQSGLSSPDNLVFDNKGNLWVACDVSSTSVSKGIYERFGNNGLFMVPTSGANAGDAYQFASGPIESELTGAWFNANYDTLFLSVQHPGEETKDLLNPTSRWPTGKGLPKPSLVAIRGF